MLYMLVYHKVRICKGNYFRIRILKYNSGISLKTYSQIYASFQWLKKRVDFFEKAEYNIKKGNILGKVIER